MRQVCVESGSAANGLASREAYSAAAACRGILPNRVKPCVGTGPVLLRWYPSLATVLTQAPVAERPVGLSPARPQERSHAETALSISRPPKRCRDARSKAAHAYGTGRSDRQRARHHRPIVAVAGRS